MVLKVDLDQVMYQLDIQHLCRVKVTHDNLIKGQLFFMKWNIKLEKLQMWIAWHLPKWLVKWCYVRVVACASTGKFANTELPALNVVTALNRFASGL